MRRERSSLLPAPAWWSWLALALLFCAARIPLTWSETKPDPESGLTTTTRSSQDPQPSTGISIQPPLSWDAFWPIWEQLGQQLQLNAQLELDQMPLQRQQEQLSDEQQRLQQSASASIESALSSSAEASRAHDQLSTSIEHATASSEASVAGIHQARSDQADEAAAAERYRATSDRQISEVIAERDAAIRGGRAAWGVAAAGWLAAVVECAVILGHALGWW
jgi:hypothetical protein